MLDVNFLLKPMTNNIMENTTNWEKTSDGYKVVGLSTGGVSMTNNNWEEEVKSIGEYLGCNKNELWSEINQILTKKDQEHKAELEMIKGEIEKFEVYDDESDNCRRMIGETIYILDSHINKLSTE